MEKYKKFRIKKTELVNFIILIFRLLFSRMQLSTALANSRNFQNGVNSKTEISTVLEKNSLKMNKVPHNQKKL